MHDIKKISIFSQFESDNFLLTDASKDLNYYLPYSNMLNSIAESGKSVIINTVKVDF